MPRGDKSSYSTKQKRQARHIEESYEDRGSGTKKAERIAWATVNKQDGGGRGKSPRRKGSNAKSSSRSTSRAGSRRSASRSR